MNSGENYYSSVSDRLWFSGNPNLDEKSRFTWFIDKSGFGSSSGYWNFSVSEAGPEYLFPANFNSISSIDNQPAPSLS